MKKAVFITMLVIIAIQFIRIDKTNPPVEEKQDYVAMTHAPAKIRSILKKACYDCHSNEVVYPWYSNVAPVSWYIKEHVNQGREYLNFSEFGKYNPYQKEHIVARLPGVLERRTMPLQSYIWLHKEAELSPEENKILSEWFNSFVKDSQDSLK
jgi:hypothetical protein